MDQGRVSEPAERARVPGSKSSDVDDPTPALGLHVRRGRLGTAEVADNLGVDVGQQIVVVGLRQRPKHEASWSSRVVDQDVESSEFVDSLLDHRVHGLGAVRVSYDGDDLPSGLSGQLARRLLENVLSPGADDDVNSLFGQLSRRRLADANASTGHNCPPAVQVKVHRIAPVLVVVTLKSP